MACSPHLLAQIIREIDASTPHFRRGVTPAGVEHLTDVINRYGEGPVREAVSVMETQMALNND